MKKILSSVLAVFIVYAASAQKMDGGKIPARARQAVMQSILALAVNGKKKLAIMKWILKGR
jgi:hypothetical protein